MSVTAIERGGERLELVAYDGKLFTLIGARAFAPGNPLTLDLALGIGHTLELKSIGSKKRLDGSFEVRARAATLTRGAREALAQVFPGSG